ncbi:putative L-ascorbate peroxidase 6, chloroplastic [Hordeum vulgare]|nr:putative L-ascorbate peroxidase 6, chloroplastic [Hordeum vulgare]
METLMVDRVHSCLRLFMNRDVVFLFERLCPPRSTPSCPPRPPPLTPPFSARSEPTPLRRRNSRQDETDLMGLLQFVMGNMVTELDEAEVRDEENATERREACNVADDEGPPAPKLPSGKEPVGKQSMTEGRLQPTGDNFQVRLGWHDAGTYDKNISEWPKCGGSNGSLRFEIELKHAANAGLVNALKIIQAIKDIYTGVTYADLFQLASATAVEEDGGPKIPMIYGRVDVSAPKQCPREGRLPGTQYAGINLLIRLQFHGDDQILRFYVASQRLVLEVS